MSADNWTACPKCLEARMSEFKTAMARVEKSYGKVPADEYIKLRREVEKSKPDSDDEDRQTLREDYSIGVNADGTFDVDYRASCTACGYEFAYEHKCDAKDESEDDS